MLLSCRKTVLFSFILFTLITAAPGLLSGQEEPVDRILLVGDSWMETAWGWGAGDQALSNAGLSAFSVEGSLTAIGGSRADQWAANQDGKLDRIRQSLEEHPAIDIIHLVIGGNDLLSYMGNTALDEVEASVLDAKLDDIRDDIQAIVDFILALDPDCRVLISGYDYLNPRLIEAAYGLSLNNVSQQAANNAFLALGLRKRQIAETTDRCFYLQNWGLLQHKLGIRNVYEAGKTPLPGQAPGYAPWPGGDPAYPCDDSAYEFSDGVHPTAQGQTWLFENAIASYYADWLNPAGSEGEGEIEEEGEDEGDEGEGESETPENEGEAQQEEESIKPFRIFGCAAGGEPYGSIVADSILTGGLLLLFILTDRRRRRC